MPPPTPLHIATSSLRRLVKEEESYHRELLMQEEAIKRLGAEEGGGGEEEEGMVGNREFRLRQEKRALEETKAVFPKLRERIESAKVNLEGLLAASAPDGDEDADMSKAREVLLDAKRVLA